MKKEQKNSTSPAILRQLASSNLNADAVQYIGLNSLLRREWNTDIRLWRYLNKYKLISFHHPAVVYRLN